MTPEDKIFFKEIWDSKVHSCEECGEFLGSEFEDEDDNVIDLFRYSHILTKQAFPMFRHDKRNINLLCKQHHNQWERGDRKKMKIYEKNQETILQLKNESKNYL